MLDAGSPLGVVYFVKKVRDSLGASPQYRYSDNTPEKRFARQKEYIDTVRSDTSCDGGRSNCGGRYGRL